MKKASRAWRSWSWFQENGWSLIARPKDKRDMFLLLRLGGGRSPTAPDHTRAPNIGFGEQFP